MGHLDDEEIVFFTSDYPDAENCPCQIKFLSSRTVDLAVSALRFAEWWQKWHDVDNEDDPKWQTALGYITSAEDELMSDCSGLATALQSLATALQAGGISGARGGGGGCQGIAGCMTGYTDDQITDKPEPGVDIGGDTPPPGFDTMEEYRIYKCQAAYAVFDAVKNIFNALSGMAGLSFTAAVIGPLIVALLAGITTVDIVFPPATIATLIGVVIVGGLIFGGAFYIFHGLALYMDSRKDEIVCSLYNTGSAASAISAISGVVEDFMQTEEFSTALGGPETPAGQAFGAIAAAAVPNQVVNPLFRAAIGVAYPSADCSGCALSRAEIEVKNDPYQGGGGTIVREGDHIHVTATWVEEPGVGNYYQTFFEFVHPGTNDGYCADMTGWSDTLQQAALGPSSMLKCAGGYYEVTTLPVVVPSVGVTNVYLRSASPFWVDFYVAIHA